MRRLGVRGAQADRASTSRRTAPAPRPAPTPGNLLVADRRDRGPTASLLCAHLDTVPLAAPVEPVLVNGGWENANDGDPRRRQQGRGRGDARARAPAEGERRSRPPVGIELRVHRLRGGLAARLARVRHGQASQQLRLRVRPRHADRRDRARLARRTTGSSPSCTGAPCTRASAPKTDAARSPPRRQRSRRCGWGASTPRRPRTSARSPAAARSTWCPIAARSRPRLAASTPLARRPSRPRWSITSRTPPMPTNATST